MISHCTLVNSLNLSKVPNTCLHPNASGRSNFGLQMFLHSYACIVPRTRWRAETTMSQFFRLCLRTNTSC